LKEEALDLTLCGTSLEEPMDLS